MSKWYEVTKTITETILVEVPDDHAPEELAREIAFDHWRIGLHADDAYVTVVPVSDRFLGVAKESASKVVPWTGM